MVCVSSDDSTLIDQVLCGATNEMNVPKTAPTQLLQHVPLKSLACDSNLTILNPRNLYRLRQRLVALQQGRYFPIRLPLLCRPGMLRFATQIHHRADLVNVTQSFPVRLGGFIWACGTEKQALAEQLTLGEGVDGGSDVTEVEDLGEAAVVETWGLCCGVHSPSGVKKIW